MNARIEGDIITIDELCSMLKNIGLTHVSNITTSISNPPETQHHAIQRQGGGSSELGYFSTDYKKTTIEFTAFDANAKSKYTAF